MRLLININMDNAAFDEDAEIPRILAELVKKFDIQLKDYPLYDINGNKVGEAEFVSD